MRTQIGNRAVGGGPAKPRGIFAGTVVANEAICAEHYRLTVRVANFPASSPGQFVQVACGAGDECEAPQEIEWVPGQPRPALHDRDFRAPQAYLRRPFSIGQRVDLADGQTDLAIIHRVVGKGTRYLQNLRVGEAVSILGPLGKGFWIPQDLELGLLVGGGVGIPPMFYLAEAFAAAGRKAVAFVGAQRKDLLPLTFVPGAAPASAAGDPVANVREFSRHGIATVLATDDGTLGYKGFVTGALTRYLEQSGTLERARIVVYCCGPTPMMKATAKVAAQLGVRCQVSLEQPMACGMGTCQSCVIRYQPAGAADWVYKLTCSDGPVFDSGDLQW